MIHTRAFRYQGVRNVSFTENFPNEINAWSHGEYLTQYLILWCLFPCEISVIRSLHGKLKKNRSRSWTKSLIFRFFFFRLLIWKLMDATTTNNVLFRTTLTLRHNAPGCICLWALFSPYCQRFDHLFVGSYPLTCLAW